MATGTTPEPTVVEPEDFCQPGRQANWEWPDPGVTLLLPGGWVYEATEYKLVREGKRTITISTYSLPHTVDYSVSVKFKKRGKLVVGLLITKNLSKKKTVLAEYAYTRLVITDAKLEASHIGDLNDPNVTPSLKVIYNVGKYHGKGCEHVGHKHGRLEEGVLYGPDGRPEEYENVAEVIAALTGRVAEE